MNARILSVIFPSDRRPRTGVTILAALAGAFALAACSHSSGGGSSGSSTPPGVYCKAMLAGSQVCYGYSNLDPQQEAAVSEACTASLQGTIAGSCPDGSVGCCTMMTAGYSTTECYYTGSADTLATACKAGSGTWKGSGGTGGSGAGGGGTGTSSSGSSGTTSTGSSGGPCTGSHVVCPSGCVDIESDAKNCGSCEFACPAGPPGTVPACVAGKCTDGCPNPAETFCKIDQSCVNLSQGAPCPGGPQNCGLITVVDCGACGHNCPPPPACSASACTNGACGSVPDPSKDGSSCVVGGKSGVCQSGTCVTSSTSSSSSSSTSSGGACAHAICTAGTPLTDTCDPCAGSVCAQDSYCCTTAWDSMCVGEVTSICGQSCP